MTDTTAEELPLPDAESVRKRYEAALTTLTGALRQDRTILAAILCGSLAYDEVWEKSDIDLLLIGDETHKRNSFTLTEDGISIHALVTPRSAFKKAIEGGLQSSFFHSYFSKSRLLYTHDDSLHALYEGSQKIGARDRAIQLMNASMGVLYALPKAQKWFHVKHDCRYAFVFLLICVEALAKIEIIARGEITGREVIHQALRVNPEFFGRVYTDLIDGSKDEAAIRDALDAVQGYMKARVRLIFGPVLDYLAEANGPRSTTEINEHFRGAMQGNNADFACEWLADQGVIDRVPLPLRLSEKSRVAVNEAGYHYDPEWAEMEKP